MLNGLSQSVLVEVAFVLLVFALLLLALWSEHTPVRLRRWGAAVGVTLVAGAFAALSIGPSPALRATVAFLIALLEIIAIVAILRRVAEHERVNSQTVMGAITAYALLAFVAAAVYRGIDLLQSAAFLVARGRTGVTDYLYFSLITLTTVGYGDVTPATQLGRNLAAVQGLVGQVFLVTLVARLVSLWGQPMPPQTRRDDRSLPDQGT